MQPDFLKALLQAVGIWNRSQVVRFELRVSMIWVNPGKRKSLMRFAGALSILAFSAGSAAFGQDAPNKDAEKDAQIDALQKQVDSVQKQLDALRAGNSDGTTTPAPDPRLDGAVRQSPVDPTADPRRLNISAPGIEGIDLFGGMAMRGDYWANYNTGGGKNDVLSAGTEAWLGARAKLSETVFASFTLHYAGIWGNNTFNGLDTQAPNRLDGSPTGTSNSTNAASVAVTEALVNFKDVYQSGIDISAGRQKIEYGAERILGDDEWRLNRTVFDGLRFDQSLGQDLGAWSLIAMRLTDGDNVVPVNGSSELSPTDVNKVDNTDLFGFYYTIKRDEFGTIDGYVFHLEDMNYAGNSVAAAGRTRFTTYGGRWQGPSWGGFSADAEAATQFGEIFGSDTNNYGFGTYAVHAGVGWSPEQKIEFLRSIHASYDYATGGSTLSDNFVQLYPSLHGWFGITDLFSWTNIQHFTLGVDADALEGVFSVNYHWMRMANANGGFVGYNAAGAGGAGIDKDLGQEFDLIYSRDCTKQVKVSTGLGYFFDGKGYRQMTGEGNDMVFAYLGFRLVF